MRSPDRGELDQIIHNAAAAPSDTDRSEHARHDKVEHVQTKRKSRFSMLTDMFGGGED